MFRQLDEGHQKQKEELNQELLEVKVSHVPQLYLHVLAYICVTVYCVFVFVFVFVFVC